MPSFKLIISGYYDLNNSINSNNNFKFKSMQESLEMNVWHSFGPYKILYLLTFIDFAI